MSEKDRWIVPVGLESRLELFTTSGTMCTVQFFDGAEGPGSQALLLTIEELSEFISAAESAQRRLNRIDQERKKAVIVEAPKDLDEDVDGWCCDPGDNPRPQYGCLCICCKSARKESGS